MTKIKVKSNQSTHTFTIRRYDKYGKCVAKYRTMPYDGRIFRNMENNTEKDWEWYLRHSGEYYVVK